MYYQSMTKYLPVAVVVVALLIVAAGIRIATSQSSSSKNASVSLPVPSQEARIKALEDIVVALASKVNLATVSASPANSALSSSAPTANLESRVKALETTVADLQLRVNRLSPPAPVSSQPSLKVPIYIPLGWYGAATSYTDWSTLSPQQIAINTADYPGYSNMQFEANLRVFQGNGIAYARLYDQDDKTAIADSTVSTSSQDYTWLSSSAFRLPGGQRNYVLQLKTSTGYEASLQNARIRINFY